MRFIFYSNTNLRIKKIFKCILCGKYSISFICKNCKKTLRPSFIKKDDVISFYKYEDIEYLIKFKYEKFGNFIFKEFSFAFYLFSKNFSNKLNIIPIDDKTDKGYSHTAILANAMKKDKKLYSTLHSKNRVKYAGKSLEYRLNNPRNFEYRGPENIDVILIDDIVTTKITINEAKKVLKTRNVNVLFSLVLADLRDI